MQDKFAKLDQAKHTNHKKVKHLNSEIQATFANMKQLKQENQSLLTRNSISNDKNQGINNGNNLQALKDFYENEIKQIKSKIVQEQNKNRLNMQKQTEGDSNEEKLTLRNEKLNEMIENLEQNMQKFGDNQKIFNNYYKIKDQREQIKKIQMDIKNQQKNFEKQYEKKSKTLRFTQKNLADVQKNIDEKLQEINQLISFMKDVSNDPFNSQNQLKEKNLKYFVAQNHGFDYHLIAHLPPDIFETQNYIDANNMLNETYFVPQVGAKPKYLSFQSPYKGYEDSKKKKKKQNGFSTNKQIQKDAIKLTDNFASQTSSNGQNQNINKENQGNYQNNNKESSNIGNINIDSTQNSPRKNDNKANNISNLIQIVNTNTSTYSSNNQQENTAPSIMVSSQQQKQLLQDQPKIKSQKNFIQRNLTKMAGAQGYARLQSIDTYRTQKSAYNSQNQNTQNNINLQNLQNINIQLNTQNNSTIKNTTTTKAANSNITASNHNNNNNNISSSSNSSNQQSQPAESQPLILPYITSSKIITHASDSIHLQIDTDGDGIYGTDEEQKILPSMNKDDTLRSNIISKYEVKHSISRHLIKNLSQISPLPTKRKSMIDMLRNNQSFDEEVSLANRSLNNNIYRIQENNQNIQDENHIDVLKLNCNNNNNINQFDTERENLNSNQQKKQRLNRSLNLGKTQNNQKQNSLTQQNQDQQTQMNTNEGSIHFSNKANVDSLEQHARDIKQLSCLYATQNIRQFNENKKGKQILNKLMNPIENQQSSVLSLAQGKEKKSIQIKKRIEQSRYQILKMNQNDSVLSKQFQGNQQKLTQAIPQINYCTQQQMEKKLNPEAYGTSKAQQTKKFSSQNGTPLSTMTQLTNPNQNEVRNEICIQNISLNPLVSPSKQLNNRKQYSQDYELEQQYSYISNQNGNTSPKKVEIQINKQNNNEQADEKQQYQYSGQKAINPNYIKLVSYNGLLSNNVSIQNTQTSLPNSSSNPPPSTKKQNINLCKKKSQLQGQECVIFPPAAADFSNKLITQRRSKSVVNKEEEIEQNKRFLSNQKQSYINSYEQKNYYHQQTTNDIENNKSYFQSNNLKKN
ncbi:hypothetical protein ABPG72_005615 [Tetrahymena utriculariae]